MMTRLLLASTLLSLSAAATDKPTIPMTDDERVQFGAPLATIARTVVGTIPARYQPCELDRDAADLIRPSTLIEGSGVTSEEGLEPANWAVAIRCKSGIVVVRMWSHTLIFEEAVGSDAVVVARGADYLHVRKGGAQREERMLVRTAALPSLTPSRVATPRTVDVRWISLTPGDSVSATARVARQILASPLLPPEPAVPTDTAEKKQP